MPIRFATDYFGAAQEFVEEPLDGSTDPDAPDSPASTFMKTALLKSNVPLDCSDVSAVNGFVITGDEPTDSSRRIIFKIDDALYKFQSGQLVPYTAPGGFGDVIKWGNKVSTLEALSNITAFVGKEIFPIIALQAPADAAAFPTIKLGLSVQSDAAQLSKTQYSPVYVLGEDTQIITAIAADIQTQGSGAVEVAVQLRYPSGTWSAYMTFAQAANQSATAVKFRFNYSVQTVGSDSACVNSITVKHVDNSAVISGDVSNLYSTVLDFEFGLKSAYAVVRHAPLVDAKIEAYVNFMAPPKHKDLVQIGTATGASQTLTLPDSSVVASSIQLFADGNPFFNFDFNTQASTVTFAAAQGAIIAATYDYDYGQEEWLQMTPDDPQPYNDELGSYSTRFSLTNDADDLSIANVRIRLRRLSGSATENLGTATGKTQLFTLKHKPKPSTIAFAQSVNFSFDEDTGILSLVAAQGSALSVSYDWLGDSPTVYSFAAGFSV
ncbi:MAG: hypothetical protein IKI76_03140 [Selenomonadaceae bacterium]|nr:hypothetical protein [Selenomonadaceae bacterium]